MPNNGLISPLAVCVVWASSFFVSVFLEHEPHDASKRHKTIIGKSVLVFIFTSKMSNTSLFQPPRHSTMIGASSLFMPTETKSAILTNRGGSCRNWRILRRRLYPLYVAIRIVSYTLKGNSHLGIGIGSALLLYVCREWNWNWMFPWCSSMHPGHLCRHCSDCQESKEE